MTGKISAAIMSLCLAAMPLTGCGGDEANLKSSNETEIRTTTMGQELLDLKKALDSGAITPAEYREQKEKILDAE